MKVLVGDEVVADADDDAVVRVEGNFYFPPASVSQGVLRENQTPYFCPWKGRAVYYDVILSHVILHDGAWAYPNLKESATDRVGHDFNGYVAFDKQQVHIEG